MRSQIQLTCAAAFLLALLPTHAAFAAGSASITTDNLVVPAAGKLTVAQVKAMIDRKDAVAIFDVNGHKSYLAGHIPGAQWIAFDQVTAAKLPKSKDAKLLFYCYNPLCGASPLAAKTALSLGYRNVWLMPAGITGWRAAHMPVISGVAAK